jgi:hypothetical protein
MAKMNNCPCGWTIISPLGEDDVVMHTKIHLAQTHPGMAITEDEIRKKLITL